MENKTNDYINIDIPERENEYASNSNTIECVICLENIVDDDPMLILECCRKKVHLKCVIDWYTKYPNNKTCFICNQNNNFCKDFVYSNSNSISNSNSNSISNSNSNSHIIVPNVIRIDTPNQSTILDKTNGIVLCPFIFILLFIFGSIYFNF
jgi:hypothetical protein